MIAIDPGASGGIVYDTKDGLTLVKMPDTMGGIIETLRAAIKAGNYKCIMEKVGTHVQGNNASASVKFARHNGHLEMALLALGIEQVQVAPKKWQKNYGTLPKDRQDRKRAIKAEMERRFPTETITLWNADALALYVYAKDVNT